MSQFLVVVSVEKPKAKILNITLQKATEGQSVFREAIDYFSIDPSHSWAVIDETGNTASSLFSEAGLALSQGDPLSTTRLGCLLGELLYSNCGLIA